MITFYNEITGKVDEDKAVITVYLDLVKLLTLSLIRLSETICCMGQINR